MIFMLVIFSGCASEPKPQKPSYMVHSQAQERSGTTSFRPHQGKASVSRLELPLSLDGAIAQALANNPDLSGALWRIEQTKAARKQAEARFWPQLSVYTEYMRGDAPSAYLFKTIDQRKLPPNANFNDPGSFENFESGVEARLNLFAGGKDVLKRRMALRETELSMMDRRRIENDLVTEVIRTYYDTLAARDFIAIAEESVTTVEEELRIMRVQYEGGAVLKSDVLSMKVRLAQAREQLVSSKNRLQLSRAALANLLGFNPDFFSQNDTVVAPSPTDSNTLQANPEEAFGIALENRPELEQVRLRLEKSQLALQSAQSAYLPRIDAIAKYYHDDPDFDYENDRENWTAAVLLNWDLFTGFSRPAATEGAEARIGEMVAAERRAYLDVALDVKTAYLNLEEARTRYAVATSSVDNAEESFRMVREHYLGGAVPVTRYLEAELDRSRARTRATAARYDRMKAAADVARSLGQWAGWSEENQP